MMTRQRRRCSHAQRSGLLWPFSPITPTVTMRPFSVVQLPRKNGMRTRAYRRLVLRRPNRCNGYLAGCVLRRRHDELS